MGILNLLDALVNNNTSKMEKGLSSFKLLYITTHQIPRFETISQNVYKKISLLSSLGGNQIRRLFSKNIPHIEALGKVKPHPHFQNLPPANKKKKPLSRRVNHALIAVKSLMILL